MSAAPSTAAPQPIPDIPPLLKIVPWPDPIMDKLGHDPRSTYVERFWLGILGPASTWLLRIIADGLDDSPAGFELNQSDAAGAMGLGRSISRDSHFTRTLGRVCHFKLAQHMHDGLYVRRRLPPLTRGQVRRLPDPLRDQHDAWHDLALQRPSADRMKTQARRLALTLVEFGEDLATTERQLHLWKFHPAVARDAATWAFERQEG